MNIITYKYDPAKQEYTTEIEKTPLREFVVWFCNRMMGSKTQIRLKDLMNYAEKRKIHIKKGSTKREVTEQLLNGMSDDEVVGFCNEFRIGVRKRNYLAAGMSESEYLHIYKSLTAVQKERGSGGRIRCLYSIREYLAYVFARKDKPWLTMEDVLKQQNPRTYSETERKELMQIMTQALPVLRARMRLSQAELAQSIGISRLTYTRVETGKRTMTWVTYMAMIAFFSSNEKTKKDLISLGLLDNQ